jgi:uncharacterized membrane protein
MGGRECLFPITFGVAAAQTGGIGGTTMANENAISDARASAARPIVRTIGPADLRDVLIKGLADFNATPTHLAFLGVIYPLLMLIFARVYAGYEVLPLVFPIIAGSTLLGPLAATGIYELSRRRELGLEVSWLHGFEALKSPSRFSIAALGVVLGTIFVIWLAAAQSIYWTTFGGVVPESIGEFFRQVFTTSSGWSLIVVGCSVGFVFAVVVLTISVISFPLLLDRNVGVVVAVQTSIRVVAANPVAMALWGLIVSGSLLLGALPLFVGLAIVMPVLGHATWHLYRKVIED